MNDHELQHALAKAEQRIAALESQLAQPKTEMSMGMALIESGLPASIQAQNAFEVGWRSALANLDLSTIQWPVVKPEDVELNKWYFTYYGGVFSVHLGKYLTSAQTIYGPIPTPGGEK